VVQSLAGLGELRKRLRQRPETQLYVNASNVREVAMRSTVELSVRVRGIECGTVSVGSSGDRKFRTTSRKGSPFLDCGGEHANGCEWSHAAVADYIEAASKELGAPAVKTDRKVQRRPEADVESAFLRALLTTRDSWRGTQQPVCLKGMPLQVAVPISASDTPKIGDGHIDVLARLGRGGKGLRVYEVKAPEASGDTALHQAVAYAATLRFLLTNNQAAPRWWTFLGWDHAPKKLPRFEAFAVVADTKRNRELVAAARQQLGVESTGTGNTPGIHFGALFYKWSATGRLGEITPLAG
jgi:hypothetical protein